MTPTLIYGSMAPGMAIVSNNFSDEIVELIQNGKIGVIRTDTLYGLVGKAGDEMIVQRIYAVKNRDDNKPPIVLISVIDDMYDRPSVSSLNVMASIWPGPVSVIVESPHAPLWLTRNQGTVAYRLPAETTLRELLVKTGPLIAPSANPQSSPPAQSIQQAINYFGDKVDFYVDGGEVVDVAPSRLLRIDSSGKVERLR